MKSGLKRIVVLSNIPSNVIEEAIFILKNENVNDEKKSKNEIEQKREFLILKEAEIIINNFAKDFNNILNKPNRVKAWHIDFLINTGLIVGISLFIYLLIKAL